MGETFIRWGDLTVRVSVLVLWGYIFWYAAINTTQLTHENLKYMLCKGHFVVQACVKRSDPIWGECTITNQQVPQCWRPLVKQALARCLGAQTNLSHQLIRKARTWGLGQYVAKLSSLKGFDWGSLGYHVTRFRKEEQVCGVGPIQKIWEELHEHLPLAL